uniref:PsbP C-terminal domain-containing protein n=1 Tax=Aegilops tauschii subsp. strangulata TaxID=200361 RepID=A0A453CBL7_AEGTS
MSSLALFSPSSSSSSLFLTKQANPTKGRAPTVVRCSYGPTLSGSHEEEGREGVMVALVGRRNALASAAAACGVSVLGFAGDGLAAAKQGPLAGRIPGLSGPDQNGWKTYRRPDEKSGGHGVGWSPIIPYSFKVPDGWEEVRTRATDRNSVFRTCLVTQSLMQNSCSNVDTSVDC